VQNNERDDKKRDDIMVVLRIGTMAFVWVAACFGTLELVHLTGLI